MFGVGILQQYNIVKFQKQSKLNYKLPICHYYRIDTNQNHHCQITNLLHCLCTSVNGRKSPKSTKLMWVASCPYSFLILFILVCSKIFHTQEACFQSVKSLHACLVCSDRQISNIFHANSVISWQAAHLIKHYNFIFKMK